MRQGACVINMLLSQGHLRNMHTKMYKINEVWLHKAGDGEGINWTEQQRNLTRDSW